MSRGVRLRIDRAALRANLRVARERAAGARVMAVVKADGYGHGLLQVAAALADGVDAFAVTDLAEAGELRHAGFTQRIVLLQGIFAAADLERAAAQRCEVVIHTEWQLEALAQARLSAPLTVWIKVDTGMHRLGFPPERVAEVWRRLSAAQAVAGEIGFITHLACADDRSNPMTEGQLQRFAAACSGLPGPRSAANSAGLLGWPQSRLDWVRPGLLLYGASPFVDGRVDHPALQPAMTLLGRLVAINHHAAGEPIGYGATWHCPQAMAVGVVSLGYGDGYPRHAPSGTPVVVAGQRTQLIGRVSMDLLTVDLRGLEGAVAPGAPVTLWGEAVRPEAVADAAGTIAYELFCRIPPRVKREAIDTASSCSTY